MIETEITLIPVKSLETNNRARPLDSDRVVALAGSIRLRGLIHTVLVDKLTGRLIAGAHRVAAFKALNQVSCPYPEYKEWTCIPARLAYDVTESEIRALEIEENIKRHEMTWQQTADAIRQLHTIKLSENPDWTMVKTAELIGMSSQNVSRYLVVAQEIENGNERVVKSQTLSAAVGIVERNMERAIDSELSELESLEDEASGMELEETDIETISIFNHDFLIDLPSYTGPKYNLIHCDFPYGINHGKSEQGRADTWGGYEDSPETFWKLTNLLFKNLDRVAYPSCHIVFWFSMNYYEDLMKFFTALEQPDLSIDPFPLIWNKSDNKGILPDYQRGPRRIYETALLISRGDRKIVQATSNLYSAPTTKEIHLSEKPESVLRYFFKMFVDEYTELLDPTCGSGTALRAAEALGAKRVMGFEINQETSSHAQEALTRARKLRKLAGD